MMSKNCIVAYGIQSILSSAVKVLVIFLTGAISGYFKEAVVSLSVLGGSGDMLFPY